MELESVVDHELPPMYTEYTDEDLINAISKYYVVSELKIRTLFAVVHILDYKIIYDKYCWNDSDKLGQFYALCTKKKIIIPEQILFLLLFGICIASIIPFIALTVDYDVMFIIGVFGCITILALIKATMAMERYKPQLRYWKGYDVYRQMRETEEGERMLKLI